MAFISLAASEVDAESPIDDALMGKIKDDLDDLNSRVIASGAKTYVFEVMGDLDHLTAMKRSICFAVLNEQFIPTRVRFLLKKSGSGGTLGLDLRKQTTPKTPIIGIDHQYSAATSSIAQAGSSLNTQSIVRATSQILTQSITHAKASKNIQSIILLGTVDGLGSNLVQYNLDTTVDADTVVGDGIVFASATSANNNGTFAIVEKNRGGGNNVVISNSIGVAQTGVAGTAQIKIMSYNFINPVGTLFAANYQHLFSGHTSALNDGTKTVYARNQSGNNIWVKNNTGVTQVGVAGALDTNFWIFALTVAASTTDYVVTEKAKTAAHTAPGNNSGGLEIILVNSGGNNLVLYNTAGVVQGGAVGNINTNRWVYSLPTNPASQVSVAQTVRMSGHTSALNDGTFTVKEVNRATLNNLVVYNESGVAQGGAAGLVAHTRKLVKFSADQSLIYSVASYIEMQGCADNTYNYANFYAPFRVLEVNRGGGANYNVVIDNPTGNSQASPAGYVQTEMKSIFTVAPSIASDLTGLEPNQNINGTTTSLDPTTIAAQTPIMLYLTSMQTGVPKGLTVTLL